MAWRACVVFALLLCAMAQQEAVEMVVDAQGDMDATVMLQTGPSQIDKTSTHVGKKISDRTHAQDDYPGAVEMVDDVEDRGFDLFKTQPSQTDMTSIHTAKKISDHKHEDESQSQLPAEAEMVDDDQVDMDADFKLKTEASQSDMKDIHTGKKMSDQTHAQDASQSKLNLSAAVAEFVAMTLFVIIGCGSAMGSAKEPGWILQVSLTFGFAITSLAYAIGHYSGGQINCAVTLGLFMTGQLSASQAILNFVGQMLGSVTGALFLTAITPQDSDKTGGLGTNKIDENYTWVNALFGEVTMTFLLMFVVLETAVNPASVSNRALACLAIGFAVFLAHSVLIPIDGCSINPTRSFGPALVSKMLYKDCEDSFTGHWVFWLGPLGGAALAALVYTGLSA